MSLLRCLTRIRPGCLIKGFRQYSIVSTNEQHGEKEKGSGLPTNAKVVICGGGVMGASVAYHLADLGVKDVVLLEQGKITCGTTWHSVGLIGQVGRDDVTNCKLMQYSKNLYKNFETLGEYVGWKECGSLLLARTKDRMTMLKKKRDIAIAAGLECDILSPKEIQNKCSWVRTDDLEGGLYIPSDGALTAPDVNVAFVNLAKKKGVQVFEGVGVSSVVSTKGRVSGVETTHGNIDCQSFVNCSGMWARDLGRKADPPVNIPLHACEHFYIATTPIKGMDPMLPVVFFSQVIRDYDGLVYFREWSGGIMAGGFEPLAKPTFQHGVPTDFQFQLLQDDWDHFQILLDAIVHRIPAMETANVQKMFNGPESFTPDGNWLIGECPELQNYFVAAGMGGTGIVSAGGVGKHLAEWILTGQPSPELSSTNIQRFVSEHSFDFFLQERVKETLGMYTMKYPFEQRKRGRDLVTSPLHKDLKENGASFIEGQNGYEIPGWFYSNKSGISPSDHYSIPAGKGTFTKPYWFEAAQDEYRACKETVGIIDMSSTAKIEIQGSEATEFLQFLVYSDIDQPVGSVIDTGMLYNNGTYVTECRVIPLENNKYLVLSPSASQSKAMSWIRKNASFYSSVSVNDVTHDHGAIKLLGPKAMNLFDSVFSREKELSPKRVSKVKIADAVDILVTRGTRNGMEEIDIHCPKDRLKQIYAILSESGVRDVGHYALKSLHMEDFSSPIMVHLNTPMECGQDPNTPFKNTAFCGKKSLNDQSDVKRRFHKFLLTDFDKDCDVWPQGGEPIYSKGVFCGTVSMCSYCFGLESMVCSGFVKADDTKGGVTNSGKNDDSSFYEIAVAGKLYKANVKQS